ncbi:MAG: glycosyltransferase family protein [Parcubacteria group bacterium]|nr:glycosyltransferase family protein [Parcubacteria group bacterium]
MIVVIIQARMGSKRFPGKVLKEIDGIPLLGHQFARIRKAKLIDGIVIATSDSVEDDAIATFCKKNNINCFRGSENDVLSRYYECAKIHNADVIVRLTGDCPLSDPKIIDEMVELYHSKSVDYAANTVPPETRKYPSGLDVEVFNFLALEKAYNEVKDKHDREHVTFYFWKYNKEFKIVQFHGIKDYSKYRVSVDYPEDLEVVEFIITKLKEYELFGHVDQIAEILDNNPDVYKKNSHYYFGIGWGK